MKLVGSVHTPPEAQMLKYIKTAVINRAVPGSGKTTITNCIVKTLKKYDLSSRIHSTDDFFLKDGKYIFDIEKLNFYHQLNIRNFKKSLTDKLDVVICDNINIAPWQTKPYLDLAREFGYQIIFITYEPRELEKHVESQKVTPEKPDAHNVPEKELKRFIIEYYLFAPLLDKRTKRNPFIHKNFKWDNQKKKRVPLNTLSPYFDFDKLIVIYPDEYHIVKGDIGDKILAMLKKEHPVL